MNDNADLIERGLQAWMVGNLDALEAVLDPQVSLQGQASSVRVTR